jgi:hypothetical protein
VRLIRHILGLVCFITFVFYVRWNFFEENRYCLSGSARISDGEFIDSAVLLTLMDISQRNPKKGDSSFYGNWEGYLPDRKDKNCCTVNRDDENSFIKWVLKKQRITVFVGPKDRDLIRFNYDLCGNLIDSDIGLPYSNTITITTSSTGNNNGL